MTPAEIAEMVERVMGLPGFTRWSGMRVLSASTGAVDLALARKPELLQFNGHFHGGVIAALADHSAGGAVTTTLDPGRIAVTIALQVNYLAPADGEELIARARVLGGGSTIAVATVEVASVTAGQERPCAFATVTLRSVPSPVA